MTLLLEPFLNALQALGEAVLLTRKTPQRVAARLSLAPAARLRRNLTLRVGQLPRLELQIADRAPPTFGRARLQLSFEIAQLLESARASGARLPRVLALQVSGGAAHLLGDIAHLLRPLRPRRTLRTILPLAPARAFPLLPGRRWPDWPACPCCPAD